MSDKCPSKISVEKNLNNQGYKGGSLGIRRNGIIQPLFPISTSFNGNKVTIYKAMTSPIDATTFILFYGPPLSNLIHPELQNKEEILRLNMIALDATEDDLREILLFERRDELGDHSNIVVPSNLHLLRSSICASFNLDEIHRMMQSLRRKRNYENAIKANQTNSTPAPNIVLPPPSQYVEDPGGTEENFQSPNKKISNQEILKVIQFLDNDPELQEHEIQ